MGRTLYRLKAKQIETLGTGRHADGGGLYLDRDDSGRSRWVFMWTRHGKRREMGLGAASAVGVSLAKARESAGKAREAVANGDDPIEARRAAERERTPVPTFGEAADAFVKALSPQWRNEKHRAQWAMTLKVYAKPLRSLHVDRVDTAAVLAVLQPVWQANRKRRRGCAVGSSVCWTPPRPMAIGRARTRLGGAATWTTCCPGGRSSPVGTTRR